MKLRILAIAAHPDDVELGCAGTLLNHIHAGQTVGILDLTEGELGTRGTPETRRQEAANAARILGCAVRENCRFKDGFFRNDEEHQRALIRYIRRWKPDVVLANAPTDRHPDHGRGAELIRDASFLSGLSKIETDWDGERQEAWRPKRVFHMIQDMQLEPTFVVDVTAVHAQKMEAVRAYRSQFHQKDSTEAMTYIASENFLAQIEYRDQLMAKRIGTRYAEGFISAHVPGVSSLDSLLLPEIS